MKFKKIISTLFILSFLLLPSPVLALTIDPITITIPTPAPQSLTLYWDASSTAVEDNVIGYKIYASRVSGVYDASNLVADVTDGISTDIVLEDGMWYFVATSYHATRESIHSNELSKKLGIGAPLNLRFTLTVLVEVIP